MTVAHAPTDPPHPIAALLRAGALGDAASAVRDVVSRGPDAVSLRWCVVATALAGRGTIAHRLRPGLSDADTAGTALADAALAALTGDLPGTARHAAAARAAEDPDVVAWASVLAAEAGALDGPVPSTPYLTARLSLARVDAALDRGERPARFVPPEAASARGWRTLGRVLLAEGRIADARVALRTAVQHATDAGDALTLADALGWSGLACSAASAVAEAVPWLHQAIRRAEQAGALGAALTWRLHHDDALAALRRSETRIVELRPAIDLARRLAWTTHELELWERLAACCADAQDRPGLAQAEAGLAEVRTRQ